MAVHPLTPEFIYWPLVVVSVIVFLAGTLLITIAWGHGRPGRFLAAWAREAFRDGAWVFLRTLVLDVLLLRRVWDRSRWRWAVHMSIFWVFILLGAFTLLSAFAIALSLIDPAGAGGAFYRFFQDLSLPYSLLAYPLVIGSSAALARRLLVAEVRGRTKAHDYFILAAILLIGLSGMFAEWFSGFDLFIGTSLLNWDLAIVILLVHIYATFLLFVMLIPFTRFRHILATPLLLLARRGGA